MMFDVLFPLVFVGIVIVIGLIGLKIDHWHSHDRLKRRDTSNERPPLSKKVVSALGTVGILCVAFSILWQVRTPEEVANRTPEEAYLAGTQCVEKYMKVPATAHFADIKDPKSFAFHRRDSCWEVGGYVDGKPWRAVIWDWGNNKWESHYVRFGDAESGQYPEDIH